MEGNEVEQLEARITELTFLCEEYKIHVSSLVGRAAYLNKELYAMKSQVDDLLKANQELRDQLSSKTEEKI